MRDHNATTDLLILGMDMVRRKDNHIERMALKNCWDFRRYTLHIGSLFPRSVQLMVQVNKWKIIP